MLGRSDGQAGGTRVGEELERRGKEEFNLSAEETRSSLTLHHLVS